MQSNFFIIVAIKYCSHKLQVIHMRVLCSVSALSHVIKYKITMSKKAKYKRWQE